MAFIGCIIWLIYDTSIEAGVVTIATFASFFRDDIHGVIGNNYISLTPKTSLIRNLNNQKYSFIDDQYINPAILEDLIGWISDTGDQVVSINISKSNNSNRYFGNISINKLEKEYPIVTLKEDESFYSYQYIGCSFSGVHILRTWSGGGGVCVFCNLLFVTLSEDFSVDFVNNKSTKIDRLVIKKIGDFVLGDRYNGKIYYKYGVLTISPCINHHVKRYKKKSFFIL